jgi:hypothetical protein
MPKTFHRLTTPVYDGGLPSSHDYLNDPTANGEPGSPATVDAQFKDSGVCEGVYLVAFGEHATSAFANRGLWALGQNTDYLDNVVNAAVPMAVHTTTATAGAPVSSLILSASVFVGPFGTPDTQDERDNLVRVVNAATGEGNNNELVDSSGNRVKATLVHDGSSNNVVGLQATGFYTNPTVNFSPAIPTGSVYRVVYGRKATLRNQSDRTAPDYFLDAFTHFTVRSADTVPGEVQKFMTEAAVRSGGAIIALATDILETPGLGTGYGKNIRGKSNTLTLDVDPDGTQGDGGQLVIRFDRDGTPVVPFRVVEADASPAHLSCWASDEVVSLRDVNVAHGVTSHDGLQYGVPWSGAQADGQGDYMLRLMDYPHGIAAQPTVLKALNARMTVVVGDGVNTFGDFNGPTAIEDAYAQLFLTGNGSLHIYVKNGVYDITGLDVEHPLIIEGMTSSGVVLHNHRSGATPAINTSDDVMVTLRNLSIVKAASNPYAVGGDSGQFVLDSCTFTDQAVKVGTYSLNRVLSARRCTFNPGPSLACVEVGVRADCHGYYFDECLFYGGTDYPVLMITGSDSLAARAVVSGIEFNRCSMLLSSVSMSGANPSGNPGVLQLVPGATSWVTVKDVTWRDCHVQANRAGSAVSMLMYLRNGTQYITVDQLSILGGRWECPWLDTDFPPFYIGGATYAAISHVNSVTIEDVQWGFSAGLVTSPINYGVAPAELSAPTNWAAFFIHAAKSLRVHNLEFISCSFQSGTCGDLWLYRAPAYDVSDVRLTTFTGDTAAATTPAFRVRIDGAWSSGEVNGLLVDPGSSHVYPGAVRALVELAPGGGLTLNSCTVTNEQAAGYYLVSEGTRSDGLSLINCDARAVIDGFYTAMTVTDVRGLVIRGGRYSYNTGLGIRLYGTSANACRLYDMSITEVEAQGNGAQGLYVCPGAWTTDAYRTCVVANNRVHDNNGGATAVQIQFGDSGSATLAGSFCGVVTGNTCGGASATPGQIYFYRFSDGAAPYSYMTGGETAFTHGSPEITAGDGVMNDGQRMLYNYALAKCVV